MDDSDDRDPSEALAGNCIPAWHTTADPTIWPLYAMTGEKIGYVIAGNCIPAWHTTADPTIWPLYAMTGEKIGYVIDGGMAPEARLADEDDVSGPCEEEEPAFRPGDVVVLNSGGPRMTVLRQDDAIVVCQWWGDEDELRGERFRASMLRAECPKCEGFPADAAEATNTTTAPPPLTATFRPGDIVRLRDMSGIPMIVAGVYDKGRADLGSRVTCNWYDRQGIRREEGFWACELVAVGNAVCRADN